METKKIRQSNYELMRIISMFFIVIWHVIIHGGLLYSTTPTISAILQLILFIIIIHVNSYVLITGYFGYEKEFSVKKFLSVFLPSWFYKIAIPLVLFGLGMITIGKWDIFEAVNPIGYSYWFIIIYLLLYLLSPYLNILIKKLNKTQHRNLLILSFILFSVLPFLTNQSYGANNGQTIVQFVFLYFLGAYLHKYPSKKLPTKKILLLGFIGCILINYGFYFIINIIGDTNNNMLIFIRDTLQTNLINYSNPIVIIQTVIYFLFFGTFNFKNKLINGISPLMFGVYLIHDNKYIREILYNNVFHLNDSYWHNTLNLIPYILLAATIIFISCIIIEKTRQICSKKLSQTKLFKDISFKFYQKIPTQKVL